MGWGDVISIGLGLGNAAINASNASTLQQMKMQQAGEALYREFVSAMRNAIFELKQTAEGVLAGEGASPLKAAGAMRILDHKLATSGITPDLFPELADKEYVAITANLVHSNSHRLYTALDKVQQAQVDQLLEHIRRLADYHYYLEHADGVSRLRQIKGVNNSGGTGQYKGCLIGLGLFMASGILIMMSPELGMLVVLAAMIVGVVSLVKLAGERQAANATKKTIEELEGSIDLPRFHLLEQQFRTPDQAQQSQKQSEQYVENFFGDYTLLQNGWRA